MNYPRYLIPTIIVAMLVVGCAGPAAPEPAVTGTAIEAPTEASVQPPPTATAAPEQVTVVDALGRENTFDRLPQRIAIAGRATALIAHTVYMFPEAIERVAALENRTQRDLSFYPIVDPRLDEKMLLERNAGAEQILPANPDVVLMKSYLAESLGEPLEQLGIPVIYLDLETPAQFERDVRVIGDLFGNPERAEEILQFYAERAGQIDELIDPLPVEQRPTVLLLQYSERGGELAFNVPSAGWLQTGLVEQAGGVPVWLEAAESGGWTIVGFEQIAAWDPQIVIVVYYPDDPAPVVESLEADANWQALQAAQNGEIHPFPGDFLSWDQPDPRWILGLQWLAKTLHPEQTAGLNLEEEVRSFYMQIYHLDPATIEAELLPLLPSIVN